MKTFTLEDYKKAIRAKYEEEKNGMYSSFLFKPSRAQLRKLCWEVFKENNSKDDLNCFSYFFQFEFNLMVKNKLMTETDKFRPIEDFFIGKSDLSDLQAVEIAAILVNFQPRPLSNYSKKLNRGEVAAEMYQAENEAIPPAEEYVNEEHENKEYATEDLKQSDSISSAKKPNIISFVEVKSNNTPSKKWWIYLLVIVGIGGSVFAVKDSFFEEKECMEWREDHYERVDCSSGAQGIINVNTRIPIDEYQFKLRKIDDSTARKKFYHNSKSVWYDKSNNNVDFFNNPGFHPVNHKFLKQASRVIIENHAE